MDMTDKKQYKKSKLNMSDIVFYVALSVYTVLCVYLIMNQLAYPTTGRFEADTPVHVSMAVDDHFMYSITALIYLLFNFLPGSTFFIALFLAASTSASIYLTAVLIKRVIGTYNISLHNTTMYLCAFASNFVMGFYIKRFNVQHYIGYQNANMWHNSTYTVMRLIVLWVLLLYLDICITKDLSAKKLTVFSLVLALSTAVKPSFFVVFAPVMALELLWDWLKNKNKFSNVFFKGITVVPSVIVILLQSVVLFGSDTGNGYAISPFTALSQRGDHPKATLILSIVFPLLVLIGHIKDVFKDRMYSFSLLIWLVGFLEVFLFTETGTRGGDGNFFWGYSISLFVVFIQSLIIVLRDFSLIFKGSNADPDAGDCDNRSNGSLIKTVGKKINIMLCYDAVCILTYVWHFVSGIIYFVLLLGGNTYFI